MESKQGPPARIPEEHPHFTLLQKLSGGTQISLAWGKSLLVSSAVPFKMCLNLHTAFKQAGSTLFLTTFKV